MPSYKESCAIDVKVQTLLDLYPLAVNEAARNLLVKDIYAALYPITLQECRGAFSKFFRYSESIDDLMQESYFKLKLFISAYDPDINPTFVGPWRHCLRRFLLSKIANSKGQRMRPLDEVNLNSKITLDENTLEDEEEDLWTFVKEEVLFISNNDLVVDVLLNGKIMVHESIALTNAKIAKWFGTSAYEISQTEKWTLLQIEKIIEDQKHKK